MGSERIQFDNDQKVAEVQEQLGARIEELRAQAWQGNVDGVELQRMEALQQELMETKRLVNTHKNNSIQIARYLVSFFGGPNAETSILALWKRRDLLLQHRISIEGGNRHVLLVGCSPAC